MEGKIKRVRRGFEESTGRGVKVRQGFSWVTRERAFQPGAKESTSSEMPGILLSQEHCHLPINAGILHSR